MSNNQSRYYKRKHNTYVTAVQIDLDTDGFTYQKWGATQSCRRDDWLVNSDKDCYTVANSSFQRTYREVSPGRFEKYTLVRATQATTAGKLVTLEGETIYSVGDYLVENEESGTDVYAISEMRFHELYELVERDDT